MTSLPLPQTISWCALIVFTAGDSAGRIEADYDTVVGDNKEQFESHVGTQIADRLNISASAIYSIDARKGKSCRGKAHGPKGRRKKQSIVPHVVYVGYVSLGTRCFVALTQVATDEKEIERKRERETTWT